MYATMRRKPTKADMKGRGRVNLMFALELNACREKKIAGSQSFYATCEVLEPWVLRQASLSSRIFLRDLAVRRTTVAKTYATTTKRK